MRKLYDDGCEVHLINGVEVKMVWVAVLSPSDEYKGFSFASLSFAHCC